MPRSTRRVIGLAVLVGAVAAASGGAAWEASRGRAPRAAARAVVDAVNAIVQADIPVDAAESTTCTLDRLPAALAELQPLVPGRHRRLIEECVHGRIHVRRRLEAFELLAMIDGPEGIATGPDAATVREFFAGRTVDVAIGRGESDGPYPLSFDWAVVLDQRSRTLFSFVLNCRD